MIKKDSLFLLICIYVILLLAACNPSHKKEAVDDGKDLQNSGDLAPMFEINDIDGNQLTLADDFKDKKVYIKYWASWCSICLAGLDELNTLAGEETDFEVITIVNPDFNGEMSSKDFKQWFSTLSYDNLTVLLDEGGLWANAFKVFAYPTSYYIGSDGVLVKEIHGHNPNDHIISEFQDIY